MLISAMGTTPLIVPFVMLVSMGSVSCERYFVQVIVQPIVDTLITAWVRGLH